jgi:hypothetical protein
LAEVTGGRIVIPKDHGPDRIPRYTFETSSIPEPDPYKENKYACPVQPIDTRPISFEMQRRKILLQNNAGEYSSEFDLLECLDSELLKDMHQSYKDHIRNLSIQDRRILRDAIIKHNEWVAEFVPAAMACLACNTAGDTLICKPAISIYFDQIFLYSLSYGNRNISKINLCVLLSLSHQGSMDSYQIYSFI